MLLTSLLLALCAQPFQEMLPGFADEVFQGGTGVYTLLFSASGFGAMLGGMWIAWRGRTEGFAWVLLISALAAPCGLVVFSVSPFLWLTLPAAALTSGGLVVAAAGSMGLIQNAVDSEVRARVMSMVSVIVIGAPALSAIAIGAIANRMSVQEPLLGWAL
ncbi:MAG: MFS transporter, partial [Rhodospirillales bacterium]|nr:MFS transporter [Rhodospirillales bacterium]